MTRLPLNFRHAFRLRSISVSLKLVSAIVIFLLVPFGLQQPASGQGGVGETFSDTPRETIGSFFDADRNFTMWVSHVDGRGIGDVMSNTAVGGNAYRFLDNGVGMFTGNFQITEFGDPTLSLGFQRRFWLKRRHCFRRGILFRCDE